MRPLAGDDTDGHIDTLARFLDPNTIAYVSRSNRNDPHYDDLKNMEAQPTPLKKYGGGAL